MEIQINNAVYSKSHRGGPLLIVADTCILVNLFNQTPLTKHAERVLDIDPQWMIPELWREEYANVICKLAQKEHRSIADVVGHYKYVLEELKDFERMVDPADALKFAFQQKISVYDAHFVVLAVELNTKVITEDLEILKKCPKYALSMKEFCDQP